jgi:hypothetical protein
MRRLAAAVCVCAALAGCSDSSDAPKRSGSPARAARTSVRSDASVIRRWADTLRAGDVASASRLFAVPAIVENGTPPQRLVSRREVRAFNDSLPCGARLLRTHRKGRYTVATFRLTERRGGDCGSGVGGTAATAFRIRDGRIAEWVRVPDGRAPRGPAPPTSTS